MAEQRKYNSGLNAKGLDKFVTEDQARGMCHHQGTSYLFIIEAHAGPKVVGEDGEETVKLIIDTAELIPAEHEERVREFKRALYLARPDQYGQEAFEGATGDEPSVEQTAAQLDAAVERDEDGNPTGVWDGDPDAPAPGLSAVPEQPTCSYPGCFLTDGHEGDHEDTETPQAAEDPVSAPNA